jgi:transcriptional regulator with XRE-family HTH domain
MPTLWWTPPDRYVAPHDVHRVIGQRLHALRLEAEVTERELSRRTDIEPKRIRYYQAGLLPFTLPILGRLAQALDLDVLDLVWDLRHPPPAMRYRRVKRLRGQGAQDSGAAEKPRITTACARSHGSQAQA